ncbi:MAG: hypothetical protein MZV70_13915 [Desulfobacterales bacterium]|nr:hypothetical protein [Desulfobacterales bacterium]
MNRHEGLPEQSRRQCPEVRHGGAGHSFPAGLLRLCGKPAPYKSTSAPVTQNKPVVSPMEDLRRNPNLYLTVVKESWYRGRL